MIMEKATAKKQKSSQLVPRESEQDEPGVLKKPALKQDDLDLVPAEDLQGKIERLKNSTKGLVHEGLGARGHGKAVQRLFRVFGQQREACRELKKPRRP